ncbi:hypothetical protein OPV22_003086 [Ensete ventricosum]|uniref:Uncharacterized protein n=1 Tax=Ensete ventricosum TaxID=4639 RepID=A0AAV8RZK1_ENSVE|nr:hypothetical protein OPV22_003086 [Ensete ventricosum]
MMIAFIRARLLWHRVGGNQESRPLPNLPLRSGGTRRWIPAGVRVEFNNCWLQSRKHSALSMRLGMLKWQG